MTSGVRMIEQSTYDEVVRENIQDLDMSPEEALADAEEQFKSQGVSLAGILSRPTVQITDTGDVIIIHPVVEALGKLKELTSSSSSNAESIAEQLRIIRDECKLDLPHRRLAATHDAFPLLITVWRKSNDEDRLVIESLTALVTGQPDLWDIDALQLTLDVIPRRINEVETCNGALRLLQLACVKHEQNRQNLMKADVLEPVMKFLDVHRNNVQVVQHVCSLMKSLVMDDDIRVEFGHAHEHAKTMVVQYSALSVLSGLLEEASMDDASVAREIVLILSLLLVRHEFCKEMVDGGSLPHLYQALTKYADDQPFVRNALLLLKALAGNDQVKEQIVRDGGYSLVIQALERQISKASVCEAGCAVLAALALRSPTHSIAIVDAGGPSVIIRAMTIHPNEAAVQKQACLAIRNLVARTTELGSAFLELGAEQLVDGARQRHPTVVDEAKAALRDLGCKVELRELWTGQKGGLQL